MVSNISKINAQLEAAGRANTRHAFQNTDLHDLAYYTLPCCQTLSPAGLRPCSICRTQRRFLEDQKRGNRFVYANEISNAEAEQLLSGFVASITSDIEFIREQVSRYGDVLLTRWKNKGKTQKKREDILRDAMHDLQEKKHPIPRFYYEINNWYDRPEDRKAWLLPWLSIEALLDDPLNIMHLLHGRTRHDVEDWVMFDNKQIDPGWHSGGLRLQHNESSVVMHGVDYGKLAKFNYAHCHRWYHIAYPRARLILEAQEALYRFLREFVKALLDGATMTEGCTKWDAMFGGTSSGVEDQSAERYAGGMFKTSPIFAPRALLRVVDSRRKEAEDELWLLQTEPAYSQYLIRQELDSHAVKMFDTDKRWGEMVGEIFIIAVQRVDFWQCLGGLCVALVLEHEQHEPALGHGKDIPKSYQQVLVALEYVATNFGSKQVKQLDDRLAMSKAFETYFLFEKRADGVVDVTDRPDKHSGFIGGEDTIDYYKTDPLFWAIYYLPECFCLPRPDVDFFDATMLLDFLDDQLASSTADERARVDSHICSIISDLAVLNQILTALRTHRPRIWMDSISTAERNACLDSQQAHRTIAARTCGAGLNVNPLGQKLHDFYVAAWPTGPKDRRWLEHASLSRKSLQGFWQALGDVRMKAMDSAGVSIEEIDKAMTLFCMAEAPQYLAELEAERLVIEKRLQSSRQQGDMQTTKGSFEFERLAVTEKDTLDIPQRKQKLKTRPQNLVAPATNQEALQRGSGAGPQPVQVLVNANHLTLFRRMYPSVDEPVAKIGAGWQHFVSAMADAGFAMTQSRGSAVSFSKPDGSIVIHRPHPDPTLEPLMLRVIGKRLCKWFGWERDTFVERTSDGA